MSGLQAALRFGVSAASASRWRTVGRKQGDAKPGPLGDDRRSKRIEAHAEMILALVDETKDITLEELRAALADQDLRFGYGTLWRFFDRRGITLKKDSACERARALRRPEAPPGVVRPAAGSRSRPLRLHRRDLGQHQHGPAPWARPRMSVPHGHWTTTTFIAGLRNTGLVAPFAQSHAVRKGVSPPDAQACLFRCIPDQCVRWIEPAWASAHSK